MVDTTTATKAGDSQLTYLQYTSCQNNPHSPLMRSDLSPSKRRSDAQFISTSVLFFPAGSLKTSVESHNIERPNIRSNTIYSIFVEL